MRSRVLAAPGWLRSVAVRCLRRATFPALREPVPVRKRFELQHGEPFPQRFAEPPGFRLLETMRLRRAVVLLLFVLRPCELLRSPGPNAALILRLYYRVPDSAQHQRARGPVPPVPRQPAPVPVAGSPARS